MDERVVRVRNLHTSRYGQANRIHCLPLSEALAADCYGLVTVLGPIGPEVPMVVQMDILHLAAKFPAALDLWRALEGAVASPDDPDAGRDIPALVDRLKAEIRHGSWYLIDWSVRMMTQIRNEAAHTNGQQ